MDAENRWWVAELLVADCEKAWLHPEEEETVQSCGKIRWKKEKEVVEEKWNKSINKG